MKLKALLFVLLLPVTAHGQARYDSNIFTAAANAPVGAQAPMYTLPYSRIYVCASPATPATGSACTNTVPIFSDQGMTQQITQPITSDYQGRYGFWVAPGVYTQSIVSAAGSFLETYTLSLGGGAVGGVGVAQISNGNGGSAASDNTTIINSLPVAEYVNSTHPPLAYWDAAFHNCRNQVVDINVHGTSRSIVDTTVAPGAGTSLSITFPNRWANRLMKQLQNSCGSHGSGIVPFRWGTGNFSSQGLNLDYFTFASGSSFAATDISLGPHQGSDAMLITADVNGSAINFNPQLPDGAGPMPYDHIRMYCTNGPGLNPWIIKIDGSTTGTCGGGSSSTEIPVLANVSAGALGTHTASLICVTQPCNGYAVEAVSGTTGISINNVSVGGASAEIFAQFPSTQYAFENIDPDQPSLDIIEQGCNEPGQGFSPAQFQATMNNMVAHDRGLTYPASTLIMAELQDSLPNQAPYYPVVLNTARLNNTSFVDMRDRWGTAPAPAFLFGPDGIHENNNGNGEVYSAIAATSIDVPPLLASPVAATSCPNGTYLNSVSAGGVFGCSSRPPTCGIGYSHYVPLTVSGDTGGSTLLNFPILVSFNGNSPNSLTLTNLEGIGNGGQVQSATGLDVIYCTAASGGVQLSHELVSGTYVPATGAGEWYVKIPSLSSAGGTIYVFWGNASAMDSSDVADVWSNQYSAVYHWNTVSGSTLTDSSPNGNNLAQGSTGVSAAAGQFGGAISALPNGYTVDATASNLPTGSNPRTLEAWIKLPSVPFNAVLFGYGSDAVNNLFAVQYYSGSFDIYNDSGLSQTWAITPDTNWHQYTFVLPSSNPLPNGVLMYADGSLATATPCGGAVGGCTTPYGTASANMQINGIPGTPANVGAIQAIDEVRISNVDRSAGWIATEYANQSNPSMFFSLGPVH
jgi:hypothetical protein